MKFHHIGIIAREIEAGKHYLETLLGNMEWSSRSMDPLQKVEVLFGIDHSNIRYEIVAPTCGDSPVWKSLEDRKNILNHVAYLVEDLSKEMQRLRKLGHIPLGPPLPAVAFQGALIQFFLNPLGSIVELIGNS